MLIFEDNQTSLNILEVSARMAKGACESFTNSICNPDQKCNFALKFFDLSFFILFSTIRKIKLNYVNWFIE